MAEVASVPWRKPADQAYLDRYGRAWCIWTVALTVPFVLTGVGLLAVTWLTAPVAAIAFIQAWINPELYAFRGASVLRPKGARHEHSEPLAQGLLGDLLDHHDPDLPPSDRTAHLLLALRTDEQGFATVGNHAFCGAPWRVRRRLPKPMRPALDAARALAKQPR